MIITTNNTLNFLKNVGALHDAFSIHEREKEYKRFVLEEAQYYIISNCVTTLKINQQKIVIDVKKIYQRFEMAQKETMHEKLLHK